MTDQPGCDCSICDEDYAMNLENRPPEFKVPSPTLNLTDRIAAMINQHTPSFGGDVSCWCGVDVFDSWEDHAAHVAAAVVEELGLLSKEHSTVGWQGDRSIGLVRYVTEWKPE